MVEDRELRARLEALDATSLCDAAAKAGVAVGVGDPSIDLISAGTKLIGRARPVVCDIDLLEIFKALSEAGEGDAFAVAGREKAIARDYFEAFTNKNLTWIDEYIAPDFVRHDPGLPFEARGPEGVRHLNSVLLTAFPDLRLDIEDVVAEGDKVLVRLALRGTHQGEFMDIPRPVRRWRSAYWTFSVSPMGGLWNIGR